jgi:hypothetical protein
MLERGEIVYVPSPFGPPEYRVGHWSLDHTYVKGARAKTKEEVLLMLDKDEEEWRKNAGTY